VSKSQRTSRHALGRIIVDTRARTDSRDHRSIARAVDKKSRSRVLCRVASIASRARRDVVGRPSQSRSSSSRVIAKTNRRAPFVDDATRDDDARSDSSIATQFRHACARSRSTMPRDDARETRPWSTREDEDLLALQREYGNRWSDIARVMGTRTGQQCAQRWRHKVNPNIRRDRWSAEEDEKVRDATEAR